MNILRLFTRQTRTPDQYEVYWMTGLERKGCVRAFIPSQATKQDGAILAELAVARFLLEDRNVSGHMKTGKGLQIHFSLYEICDLVREESGKFLLVPYALFLKTRFRGFELEIDIGEEWIDDRCQEDIEDLIIQGPVPEVINFNGCGDVEITSHAISRFCELFKCPPELAWRHILKLAGKTEEVVYPYRPAMADLQHRRHAHCYLAHYGIGAVFVITEPMTLMGKPGLATVHQLNTQLCKKISDANTRIAETTEPRQGG